MDIVSVGNLTQFSKYATNSVSTAKENRNATFGKSVSKLRGNGKGNQ